MPPIRYVSLFSGLGAASFALGRIRKGFKPLAFAEICPDASAVLASRFPSVPNIGDVGNVLGPKLGTVDVVLGGPPCQPFSMAGGRAGLHSPEGHLTLRFWDAAWALRFRLGLMENVPGMLMETFDGRDNFGSVLGHALGHPGYAVPRPSGGWPRSGRIRGPRSEAAWRTLDTCGFGGSQARNRLLLFVSRCPGISPSIVLGLPRAEEDDPAAGGGGEVAAVRRVGRSSRPQIAYTGWNGDETPKLRLNAVPTLRASQGGGGTGIAYRTHDGVAVMRRLTPEEREAVSGLPPRWTDVPGVSERARERLTGNTLFTPMMAWIGIRIAAAIKNDPAWKRKRGRPRYYHGNRPASDVERKAISRARSKAAVGQ